MLLPLETVVIEDETGGAESFESLSSELFEDVLDLKFMFSCEFDMASSNCSSRLKYKEKFSQGFQDTNYIWKHAFDLPYHPCIISA